MKQWKRALNLTSVGIVNSTCVFLYRRDTRATNKERWPFPFLRSRRYNFRPRFALKFLHLARFFPSVAFHLRLTRHCRYFSLSLFPPSRFFLLLLLLLFIVVLFRTVKAAATVRLERPEGVSEHASGREGTP